MAKQELSIDELKEKAIKAFDDYIEALVATGYVEDSKRAKNLSKWVYKYINCLSFEKQFNPSYLPRYKRGNIILVDFGYRIGNEEGGQHYAIVVEGNNNKKDGTLTVIPMTSDKPNRKPRKNEVNLGTVFFDLVIEKSDAANEAFTIITDELAAMMSNFDKEESSLSEEDRKKRIDEILNKYNKAKKQLSEMKNITKQIEGMKEGGIALVDQITTISKLRVLNPTKPNESLYGIKLRDEQLTLLDEAINKFFHKHE